jgi:hypothetical protein
MTITHNGAATTSNQRACVGPLACYIDSFAEFLACEGYTSQTVKVKQALVADLSRAGSHDVDCRWQDLMSRGSSSFTPTIADRCDAAMCLPAISCWGCYAASESFLCYHKGWTKHLSIGSFEITTDS